MITVKVTFTNGTTAVFKGEDEAFIDAIVNQFELDKIRQITKSFK